MKFLLLWVALIPIVSFLKFVATDLMDCLVVKEKVRKQSAPVYGEYATYKKAQ